MKRQKNCYTVGLVSNESSDIAKEKRESPVFVQAWNYREAIERAADAVMACHQLHGKLLITRMRPGRPVDHVTNPWREFYVNRRAVIHHISRAK